MNIAELDIEEDSGDEVASDCAREPKSWIVAIGWSWKVAEEILRGSCRHAGLWAMRAKGWGGTGLLIQTPIRHLARTTARRTSAGHQIKDHLPADYVSWAWPGPAARAFLDRVHGGRVSKITLSKYAAVSSAPQEMVNLHTWMVENTALGQAQRAELETLKQAPWELHNSEAGMCFSSKYCSLREVVQFGAQMPSHVRWRSDALAFVG
jgi:hypothetical protein